MTDKKPSTPDIMAKIRGGAAKPAGGADSKPAVEPAASAPKTEAPAAAPSGTANILASIKGGGAAKPAAAAPSGTSDILASIKGGGAAKPAGPAPTGTAGILASIKGGGGGSPAAAKPAGSAAPAAAKASVDSSAAAGLSAAEMIKAARSQSEQGGASKAAGSEVKKPAGPPLPAKPLAKPAAAKKPETQNRRSALGTLLDIALSPLVVAWTSLVSATAVSGLAMARFMMPNVLVEPPTKFKIGPLTDYAPGTVSTKWKAQFGVWIVNDEIDGQQMIYALSTVCTHLGCTPNWLEGEQKFKCPCHGSGFYKTGINFEGPAPRPLERHGIRIAEDGMLEVDKSLKFQMELGQWESASSYVPV